MNIKTTKSFLLEENNKITGKYFDNPKPTSGSYKIKAPLCLFSKKGVSFISSGKTICIYANAEKTFFRHLSFLKKHLRSGGHNRIIFSPGIAIAANLW